MLCAASRCYAKSTQDERKRYSIYSAYFLRNIATDDLSVIDVTCVHTHIFNRYVLLEKIINIYIFRLVSLENCKFCYYNFSWGCNIMFWANRYPRHLPLVDLRRFSLFFFRAHKFWPACNFWEPARHLFFIVRRALQRHGKILPPSCVMNKKYRRLNVPVSTLECSIHNRYCRWQQFYLKFFSEL